jgi:hypothetical protein
VSFAHSSTARASAATTSAASLSSAARSCSRSSSSPAAAHSSIRRSLHRRLQGRCPTIRIAFEPLPSSGLGRRRSARSAGADVASAVRRAPTPRPAVTSIVDARVDSVEHRERPDQDDERKHEQCGQGTSLLVALPTTITTGRCHAFLGAEHGRHAEVARILPISSVHPAIAELAGQKKEGSPTASDSMLRALEGICRLPPAFSFKTPNTCALGTHRVPAPDVRLKPCERRSE